jgi:hypothetical protein
LSVDHILTLISGYPETRDSAPILGDDPLAAALEIRYVRYGDATDLDQAITMAAEAVTRADGVDPYSGMYLSNLSFMLRVRSELRHAGAVTDLG